MGTQFYAVCLDCKVYRDVDKHMAFCQWKIKNRQAALKFADDVANESFRSGLLLSFLLDHAAHRCNFISEHEFDSGPEFGDMTVDGIVVVAEKVDLWNEG